MSTVRDDTTLDVEVYRVDALSRASERSEGHRTLDLAVTPRRESRKVQAGTWLVPTGQPLGNLVVYLLEPGSDDGLFTWNAFDDAVAVGAEVPVLRVPAPVAIATRPE
jgi:hypothetical protein